MKKTFLYAICILAALNCREKTEEKLPVQEKLPTAKETPKPTGGTGNWSASQGVMNWNDAKARCASLGMRLPTLAEFNAAYDSGVTKSWNDLSAYWTSDAFSDFRAYFFNIDGGYSNHYRKDVGSFYVRCIR